MRAEPTITRWQAVLTTAALITSLLVIGPSSQAGPRNSGSAGAAGDAGSIGAVARMEPPAGSIPGIDVSHWQNTIDWSKVAGSGTRFAFAKATDGRTYVDPMYATNRAGAAAAGIAFGAYHFARPDHGANDALIEADHFVDSAMPATGDLLPVLDLESTGGLAPDQLTEWMLAWLDEVTLRIGVRPIVYTSPNGWANRSADTTAIADAGYTVLWVAHWGVSSPTVPANDWQGNGWTFWQYSNCGHVAGIQGCVDADWYDGTTFDGVTIPSPDTSPPLATITTPTGVAGPVTVSFNEIALGVTPSNVVLRVADTGADVPSSRTCVSKDGRTVDCQTGKVVAVTLQPDEGLISGQTYTAVVNPAEAASPVVDRSGNAALMTELSVTMPTDVEQGSAAVRYSWRTVSRSGTYGGSYFTEHLDGASASFSFMGSQVTWYTVTGPTQGKASISIDGRARGTFNQYASTTRTKVAHVFSGLAKGEHTITVRVLGQVGAPGASDTQVAIDAFRSGGKTWQTPDLDPSWRNLHIAGASGGSVVVSDSARASLSFRFRGTGVTWETVRGPAQGRAQLFIDGALVKTVDNYAQQPTSRVTRTIASLLDGVHELRIVVLGSSRPASRGTFVSVDGFSVA
jgi:GH25 family lysozyme M1 (1,4-beta-N-acetylmuramidase)